MRDTYAPSSDAEIAQLMALARIMPGERVLELGSGDGRVVAAAAQRGGVVTGCEIDNELVRKSQTALASCAHVRILGGDYLMLDWHNYDVVIAAGVERLLSAVREKFSHESRVGARLVVPAWAHAIDDETLSPGGPGARQQWILLHDLTFTGSYISDPVRIPDDVDAAMLSVMLVRGRSPRNIFDIRLVAESHEATRNTWRPRHLFSLARGLRDESETLETRRARLENVAGHLVRLQASCGQSVLAISAILEV